MPLQILGVFAKQPLPGQAKTRLAAATTPEFAADVAEALLLDTLDRVGRFTRSGVLAFAPADARSYFSDILPDGWTLETQSKGDLGERLASFCSRRFREGADRVVLLGSDSPNLPAEFLTKAFDSLQQKDVVLAPATDGGYCLLGCRSDRPHLFADVPWGTCRVLEATIRRIDELGLTLALLPAWQDVDLLDDLFALRGLARAQRLAGIDPGCPRTERLLSELPFT